MEPPIQQLFSTSRRNTRAPPNKVRALTPRMGSASLVPCARFRRRLVARVLAQWEVAKLDYSADWGAYGGFTYADSAAHVTCSVDISVLCGCRSSEIPALDGCARSHTRLRLTAILSASYATLVARSASRLSTRELDLLCGTTHRCSMRHVKLSFV